ncbi:MAG TPA: TlpA disulfide reductase family protein [Planctomycetota bacterium]|nr:TlpA disulfide reductase family protein [Planctomycetota bacterium]
MIRSLTIGAALFAGAMPAQEPQDSHRVVDELREIANRAVRTEADSATRAAAAAAWLEATAEHDLGELAVLRTLAGTFAADEALRRRSSAALVEWFRQHDALPVPGFEDRAGDVVLFDVVHRADDGLWSQCEELLPTMLRVCRDHRSAYWLLGRRGRDAGSAEGTQFLQHVVIPALLADHTLDDADRVHLLRLLYNVEYTGPKPFVDVAGPGLDGKQVRTADHRGGVLLVDYWATWCRPCLMALPGVVAAHQRFRDQGFDVVGISIDDADARSRVLAKVAELGITFPVIFDGKGSTSAIAEANKVLAIPATFLIDRRGRVRYTGLEGDELPRRIAELLAEK